MVHCSASVKLLNYKVFKNSTKLLLLLLLLGPIIKRRPSLGLASLPLPSVVAANM